MAARSASSNNRTRSSRKTANAVSLSQTSNHKSRSAQRSRHRGFLAGVFQLFFLTYFGRIILILCCASAIILLNILVSGNQFDLFFRILGIELVLTVVIFWLRFLLKKT